jgi:para-aminobenzoate synthetase component 1
VNLVDTPALRTSPSTFTRATCHPDAVFGAVRHLPNTVYLWGDGTADKGRYSIVAYSPDVLISGTGTSTSVRTPLSTVSVAADPLAVVEQYVTQRRTPSEGEWPFCGGAIGYITYEHACRYLNRKPVSGSIPDVQFGVYDRAYVFDHQDESGYWIGPPVPLERSQGGPLSLRLDAWQSSVSKETYLDHLQTILAHIGEGDIYQANYTLRHAARGTVNEPELALRFRQSLPSPLGAYLSFFGAHIWSLSPERLLRGKRGSYLESRPIKGTRRRHRDPIQDAVLRNELLNHPKDRAELLMIVDLVRNDLGRVASAGSVTVDDLYGQRSYVNVHHLESLVRSDFPADRTWRDALSAILPGGSVTGAPKQRAVDILAGLEPVPRSVYTGAIGYLSYDGGGDFNLPIRTLYHDGSTFYLHSGGGIVADSDPQQEFEEAAIKVSHILSLLNAP